MAYEDKPLTGVLFKNKDKTTDNHPDYKGNYVDENGVKFWLSAWINESQKGEKYMKLSTSPMDEQFKQGMQQTKTALEAPQSAPAPQAQEFDDVPF